MAQSIDDSIEQVRTIVRGITGIRSAPAGVPDNDHGIYPFFVAWNGGGEVGTMDDGWQIGLWNIVGQLHFSRADLYRTEAYSSTFPALIVDTLLARSNYNLGGYCETFGKVSVSNFKPLVWGDVQTLGYEFTIQDVKIQDTRDT